MSGLLVGATIVLFDGDPGAPDLGTLWRLAADTGVDVFGVSAPFLMSCRKAGVVPPAHRIRGVGSTGAPLPPDGFRWVHDVVGSGVQLQSVSGGTDVCAAFVGAVPLLPVRAGEISCRLLGCAVEAFDADGNVCPPGVQGELVVTEPMPSMPVGFWGDPTGEKLRHAYFADYPGRLASRRLDHLHRRRCVRHLRSFRRHAQPGRCAPRYERLLRGGRGPARGRRQPGRAPGGRRSRPADGRAPAVRRAHARHRRSTTTCAPPSSVHCVRSSHPGTCPTRSTRFPRCRARSRARSSRCRSSGSSGAPSADAVASRSSLADPTALDWFEQFGASHRDRSTPS